MDHGCENRAGRGWGGVVFPTPTCLQLAYCFVFLEHPRATSFTKLRLDWAACTPLGLARHHASSCLSHDVCTLHRDSTSGNKIV
eukprot:XP_001699983.1 predicted protein [Chlamydomonas reinhardtii]